MKYANTMDENEIQEMRHVLAVTIPVISNPLPAQQTQNEPEVPPDGGINDPTSKTPIKASIGGTTRKRGRPRTDSVEGGPGKAKKGRTRKGQATEKENRPPKVVDVDEQDVFLAKGRVWSAEDKTKFFEWFLGPDGDEIFTIHKTNPERAFQKVFFSFALHASCSEYRIIR